MLRLTRQRAENLANMALYKGGERQYSPCPRKTKEKESRKKAGLVKGYG